MYLYFEIFAFGQRNTYIKIKYIDQVNMASVMLMYSVAQASRGFKFALITEVSYPKIRNTWQ